MAFSLPAATADVASPPIPVPCLITIWAFRAGTGAAAEVLVEYQTEDGVQSPIVTNGPTFRRAITGSTGLECNDRYTQLLFTNMNAFDLTVSYTVLPWPSEATPPILAYASGQPR